MILNGSHDDPGVSKGIERELPLGRKDLPRTPEPLSAREVYTAIMLHVAKEHPELKLAMR